MVWLQDVAADGYGFHHRLENLVVLGDTLRRLPVRPTGLGGVLRAKQQLHYLIASSQHVIRAQHRHLCIQGAGKAAHLTDSIYALSDAPRLVLELLYGDILFDDAKPPDAQKRQRANVSYFLRDRLVAGARHSAHRLVPEVVRNAGQLGNPDLKHAKVSLVELMVNLKVKEVIYETRSGFAV